MKTDTRFERNYFLYLSGIVQDGKHNNLLETIHEMDFYSLIPNDDNRGKDGIHIRQKFIDEEGLPALSQSIEKKECSVLEMLIGLSFRLEFETMGSRYEKTPKEWFWILVDNLGLTDITDENFSIGDQEFVTDRVSKMLERRYDSNGNGGLFPLKRAKKDQRRVEIWYQMSAYVLENYPI